MHVFQATLSYQYNRSITYNSVPLSGRMGKSEHTLILTVICKLSEVSWWHGGNCTTR